MVWSGLVLPSDELSRLRDEVEADLRVEVTNDQQSLHRALPGFACSDSGEGEVSVVIDGSLPVHGPGERELVRLLVNCQSVRERERERERETGYNVTLST